MKGGFIELALQSPQLWKNGERQDRPSNSYWVLHTGEANTLIFVVNGTNAVNSFVHALNRMTARH